MNQKPERVKKDSSQVEDAEKVKLELQNQLAEAQAKREKEEQAVPAKPKRGRPKKVEVPELPPKLIQSMVSFPFDYLGRRIGSHWELVKEEKEQLAAVSNTLINKYIPTVLARFPEEIAFTLCLGFIVAKRLFVVEKKEKEE